MQAKLGAGLPAKAVDQAMQSWLNQRLRGQAPLPHFHV
ncbi:hypothetical protein C4J83_0194 [Pseudomonas sp. LBUM920]|nr:hypothetical protein C4J83_0194 [Pseudomonas sp. LBUM920]